MLSHDATFNTSIFAITARHSLSPSSFTRMPVIHSYEETTSTREHTGLPSSALFT